jgi:hypothetical protein
MAKSSEADSLAVPFVVVDPLEAGPSVADPKDGPLEAVPYAAGGPSGVVVGPSLVADLQDAVPSEVVPWVAVAGP